MKLYMKIIELDPKPRYKILIEVVNNALEQKDEVMIALLCTNHDKAMFAARRGFKSEYKKL